ncbi:protein kinase [Candidatus Chloroploca sp. M-50]|uniref:non-specific serine/threonine protein kinase n=1 Tax=Candidatus Chloroploca mongolica TaxID=2528176 RepID=A0ABS4D414_9CHLR|nr:serine/threonine-protein kinase [Candidatus Chloroploca mongolica]MBP1464180.1 protein kinase [Candidatus Chloroploca mongolica]
MTQPQEILCPSCRKPGRRQARFCQYCGHDMVLNNAGPHYYITRVIKAGGQGAVYEGIDDDGNIYAVKEMLDSFTEPKERDEAIKRFNAEAELLEQLTHPRIPRVYSHFKDEGRHYLVMDYIRGEDLEDIVEREGKLAEPRVLEWATQICDVLSYLHSQGLIYRDMKPSNVMIDHQNGGIKLIDFGIARVLQVGQRGTQIGTPGYAPPEQYQGLATIESDVYALGATLHHVLTGRDPQAHPPFSFPPARTLEPTLSPQVSGALEQALQMRPTARFASIAAFGAALGVLPASRPLGVPVSAQPTPTPTAAPAPTPATSAAPPSAVPPPPAQPAPPPAQPAPPPAQPAPASVVQTAGAVQPTPQAAVTPSSSPPAGPVMPTPVPPPAPASPPVQPKRRGCAGCIGPMVITILLIAGLVAVDFFFIGFLPRTLGFEGPAAPISTPQTLVQIPFTTEIFIVDPDGTDQGRLQTAFATAFLEQARQTYGPTAQLDVTQPLIYADGPTEAGREERGIIYRAVIEGFLLVPQ